jgi:large subunit ribosomal protein L29
VKASDLRELSAEELQAKAGELRDEIFNARVRQSTGQLEDKTKIRLLRRDLARAETVMREQREAQA